MYRYINQWYLHNTRFSQFQVRTDARARACTPALFEREHVAIWMWFVLSTKDIHVIPLTLTSDLVTKVTQCAAVLCIVLHYSRCPMLYVCMCMWLGWVGCCSVLHCVTLWYRVLQCVVCEQGDANMRVLSLSIKKKHAHCMQVTVDITTALGVCISGS